LESIRIDGTKALIQTTDMDQAQFELHALILRHRLLVRKFATVESTLEDVFFKVVNGNA
jgi:hypothetical protein